ncbi:MAG TPA: hypothetical protein VGX03_16745 [Candidatus Binatia bacterium]|nr:hypothetical protein [Candidatus Binatia bacterium]
MSLESLQATPVSPTVRTTHEQAGRLICLARTLREEICDVLHLPSLEARKTRFMDGTGKSTSLRVKIQKAAATAREAISPRTHQPATYPQPDKV